MSEGIGPFTPRETVSELDRYIIGQKEAKRAVSIAMRNRWRRQQVAEDLREEIAPKNIIMIGPTGVGKTEIARRLSKLANAPFIKVEASKFTEVGYVGKDVESMIRDLIEIAVNMIKAEEEIKVQVKAEELAEERLLDLLIPRKPRPKKALNGDQVISSDNQVLQEDLEELAKQEENSREKMRQMLRQGKLDTRSIELNILPHRPMGMPMIEVISTGGSLEDMSKNIREMFSGMFPKDQKRRKVKVKEALKILKDEEIQRLIEMEEVVKKAIERTEQHGVIFIDEIDKIASREKAGHGPEVSREGVQRDILPIVEGSRVNTKYGIVKTDHILFIAAGAFHVSKPSDLIPELQGRFPIRVELHSLSEEDFLKILTEPKNALIKQYIELMKTEGVELDFSPKAIKKIAHYAAMANDQMENIGARRLHTILEKVLDEISFTASERSGEKYKVDDLYVKKCLEGIIKDQDLGKYIL